MTHLAVVDADDGANHLGDDDHVAQVGLDDGRLLVWRGLLLGLAQLLEEAHGLALETALEPPAGTSVDDLVGWRKCDSEISCVCAGSLQGFSIPQRTRQIQVRIQ